MKFFMGLKSIHYAYILDIFICSAKRLPDSGVPDPDPLGVDGNLRLAVLVLHLDGDNQQLQLKTCVCVCIYNVYGLLVGLYSNIHEFT